MDFISQHKERGFFHQCTDLEALTELTKNTKISAYIGFDCTASSLHVGNLMQIMILRLLQKTGHKPIVIVGGGTTKIGDPSGKDEARKMLTEEQIAANMEGIKANLQKFIKFGDGPSDAVLVNNNDWLSSLGYIEFLSNYGRLFSINRMLSFDSVKLRLEREQNLTFLEFNYMLLQSFDFVELNRRYKCVLQLGGSDQWGNIVSGVELGRRLGVNNLYGLTSPLITTSSGAKMGKSVSGAIWLSEDMLSSYDYYQFWRNTEDNDVIRFLKLYTELPIEQINELEKLQGSEINEAKKILAFEATKLCHSEEKARMAEETARNLFEQNKLSDNLPTFYFEKAEFANGKPAFELLVVANLAESNGEARRLIRGNGAKINDVAIASETDNITLSDFQDGVIKLSAGKKKHALIKLK